jgi:hypothetical protein
MRPRRTAPRPRATLVECAVAHRRSQYAARNIIPLLTCSVPLCARVFEGEELHSRPAPSPSEATTPALARERLNDSIALRTDRPTLERIDDWLFNIPIDSSTHCQHDGGVCG